MKKLVQGSIVRIPLLKGLGYAYAKYIDLTKLDPNINMPEIIKVYKNRTEDKIDNIKSFPLNNYLLSPILVAGLRPTIKKGLWDIVGTIPIEETDTIAPDFKGGNEGYEELERGEWFLYRKCKLENKEMVDYEQVKYLQPYMASGTGNIEIELTMHFLIQEGKNVADYFDLEDETYKWCYQQVKDSPMLGEDNLIL